ncbi:hypothetical protein VB780_16595 [Leptolyngbya sp. CCNP1308]|uniref:hypothetical protein n=1 Tax=Leptolyngbya sp. CCNP1308 TaxID=3110255 RepID=UPI002B213129|nr:hypothetical protein [Leptolyngbya sp. CCNP1308]MEA5450201.1 hypothetical protein [Leptolyngbya sp. CCNP1308]
MQLNLLVLPDGLDRTLTDALTLCAQQADPIDLTYLGDRVQAHLQRAHFAAQANPMVNVALAEAIATTYTHLLGHWPTLTDLAMPWLKGAMLYFVETDDDDPDFDSPIGFEDDVEVLNACLRMAGLEELCLSPEDFD